MSKGGTVSLYLDAEKTGEGRVDRSTPMLFSLDDKTGVGADRGTPVSDDYTSAGSEFNGKIKWVQIDLGEDAKNTDRLITAEDRFQLALATQ
jgi:arylsulfatase